MFTNTKTTIIILSAGLVIFIAILFLPNLFGSSISNISRTTKNPEITAINTQSKDTTTESIKKDLEATDVTNLYQELDSIEQEINATN